MSDQNRVENRVGDPIFHPILDPILPQKPHSSYYCIHIIFFKKAMTRKRKGSSAEQRRL